MSTDKRIKGQNIKIDVTHKQLMKQIAETSGYHLYEVEDIMLHFVAAIQKNIRNKKTTAIHCLGKFRVTTKFIPERFSVIANRTLPARAERHVRFAASDELKRAGSYEGVNDE